jgi:hypothetical protein
VAFDPPTENLSVEDLKRRYDISKQTLYARKNASRITGIHIKGKTYFSPDEVWCFDQVATFVERGMTLPQIEKLVAEWKSEEPQADIFAKGKAPTFEVGGGVPPAPDHAADTTATATGLSVIAEREDQARQLARAFTTAVGQALQDTQQIVTDPLRIHRLLSEAAREEWVLTGVQLGEICGLDSGSIPGWRPSTIRCGFLLTCIGTGLWKVRKATEDEIVEASRAKKVPGPKRKSKDGGEEETLDAQA